MNRMINMNKNMHKYPRSAHKNLDLHKDVHSTCHKNPTIDWITYKDSFIRGKIASGDRIGR